MKPFRLFFFFLFLCSVANAQYQFGYELTFRIDSTRQDHLQKEHFNLDAINGNSVFYVQAFSELDSIKAAGGNVHGENAPEPKLNYLVIKELKEDLVLFHEMIGFANYEVPDPRKMEWEIHDDTKNYQTDSDNHQYELQKATTTFGGRDWIAWFASEIPVQDGPYKFHGLPGLIFELQDTQEDYVFSLISIKKIERLFSPEFLKSIGIDTHSVGYDKYKQLRTEFYKNPGAHYRQYTSDMGVKLSNADIRNFSNTIKSIETKQNNPIELPEEE